MPAMSKKTADTRSLAEQLEPAALERFQRYVQFDTQSREGQPSPSSPGQIRLGKRLVKELQALELEDVHQDKFGIVTATLAGSKKRSAVLGLLAHLDTSPAASGKGVKPRLLRSYDGSRIEFPADPSLSLDPADDDELRACLGHDLVFTQGDTLLGADDKAGIAAILSAVQYLVQHPKLPRPRLRLAFTPDEEIAGGVKHLDLTEFGAEAAYTFDGGGAGIVEAESFSADRAVLRVHGKSAHPGMAGAQLVNALRVAARFVALIDIPPPERSSGREGFVHPYTMQGGEESAEVALILRSFDESELRTQERLLTEIARQAAQIEPRATFEMEVQPQYRNMAAKLSEHPHVAERAREAIARAGLTPTDGLIRGGTDGSMLTERGLPCPNLSSGQHRIHSTREWLCARELGQSAEVAIHLAAIWAGH